MLAHALRHDISAPTLRLVPAPPAKILRSPLKYAGSKRWLIPTIRQWLAQMPAPPALLLDPFAGGGSISINVASNRLAEHVTMVELDNNVAAVWQVILTGDAPGLIDRIQTFRMTPETVRAVLAQTPATTLDRAFRTIVRNRVQFGGIMAPGAGLVKHNEDGRHIDVNWCVGALCQRIRGIAVIRDRFSFHQGDAFEALRAYEHHPDIAIFLDPPYTAGGKNAGTRLYDHFALDHNELFHRASRMAGSVLMTYDDAPEVRDLARRYGFQTMPISMISRHHVRMTELLVARNLDWAADFRAPIQISRNEGDHA